MPAGNGILKTIETSIGYVCPCLCDRLHGTGGSSFVSKFADTLRRSIIQSPPSKRVDGPGRGFTHFINLLFGLSLLILATATGRSMAASAPLNITTITEINLRLQLSFGLCKFHRSVPRRILLKGLPTQPAVPFALSFTGRYQTRTTPDAPTISSGFAMDISKIDTSSARVLQRVTDVEISRT